MYNKKSANWYAVPMKIAKEYGYVTEIQTETMRRRMVDRQSILRRLEMLPGGPRRISRTPALSSPPPPRNSRVGEETPDTHGQEAGLIRPSGSPGSRCTGCRKRHQTRMAKRLASSGQAAHLVADVQVVGAREPVPDSPDHAAGDHTSDVMA